MTQATQQAMPPMTATAMEEIRTQFRTGQASWRQCTDAEAHIPATRYFSPEAWQAEVQQLFRALPLIVAHSSELGPGQVLAHDSYGLPLLLSRDAQGTVRCFLNVCRHRGMRLVEVKPCAESRASLVCPYHGWAFKLDGQLRHQLHAESFDPCKPGERDLVTLPCAERHGMIWVIPDANATLDLPAYLGGLDAEMPYLGVDKLVHFRTVEAEYPANWKLIIDAFLEAYHIRVLHRDTIFPFFTDGISSAMRFGPHICSLVARRAAQDWAQTPGDALPDSPQALCKLVTPSQVIFPNTVTIFHPDYLSLISAYPTGPETMRWTHRMLIPAEKATPDWAPHWEKTFKLIEQGVFQKEDIHCAIGIQKGLKSGANDYVTAGRMEQALGWFHGEIARRTAG